MKSSKQGFITHTNLIFKFNLALYSSVLLMKLLKYAVLSQNYCEVET